MLCYEYEIFSCTCRHDATPYQIFSWLCAGVGWGVVGWGGCHTVLWLLHMGCMLRHEIFSCAHADTDGRFKGEAAARCFMGAAAAGRRFVMQDLF